jgi:hypothetical protein
MDESSYPLAQTDHAYAYEGAYRTPSAMSAATRDAYGMRGRRESVAPISFQVAMRAAAAQARSARATRAPQCTPSVSRPYPRHACVPVRNGVQQAAPDHADSAAHAPARIHLRPPHPGSFYYLFTSAAGCDIRAIVWRGRVYCGGKRPCPTSTP